MIGKAAIYTTGALLAVTCVTLAMASVATAEGRIALLLAAEKYQHFKASKVTVAQNKALEQALSDQGFDVMIAADPGNAAARAALSEFSRKAESADFALIVASGHFATYRNQSFFLPTNARVRRATDLFSRGLSAANIADIVHRAKAGAFLMVTTVPDIPSTIAGVGAQPSFANPPPDNIVAVFSTSSKIPVSRVEGVSVQVMKDLVDVAQNKPMMLADLVSTASAGGAGLIVGKTEDRNLSQDAAKPKPEQAKPAAETAALKEANRKARELAEKRLNQAEERARRAEKRAKEAEARAKRELAAAAASAKRRAKEAKAAKAAAEAKAKRDLAAAVAAAARKAAADKAAALRAEAERKSAAAQPPAPATPVPTAPADPAPNIQSLQVVEALLGRGQRRVIQRILKSKGYYNGPIDAIFGDQTRAAIRDFQRDGGARETGYLTPDQLQQLVASR
ncbi:MAG: peptidoglycan-binding protein [Hyphomicrobiaceae bacterium]